MFYFNPSPVRREEARTPTKNKLPVQYSFNTNLSTMKKSNPSNLSDEDEIESRNNRPSSYDKPTMLPKDLEASDNEVTAKMILIIDL